MSDPIQMYPAAAGSGPIVYDAYEYWKNIAMQAFTKAEQLATAIGDFPIQPVNFNATFNPQLALTAFPTLPKPVVPGDLTYHAPALPPAPPVIIVPVVPQLSYVSQLLDGVKNALGAMLGGNAMPPALAAAIIQRAYADAYAEEARAVDNATNEWASRGFEEPAGQLNRRVTEARADARAKRQLMNRDVYIQEQQLVIENLRFAITAGLQLEATNVQVFTAEVDAELKTVEIATEQNRLKLDGWRAQVEMYDEQLKAEIARIDTSLKAFEAQVEVYRADAQIATAAGDYDNRRFQLNLSQEQAIVDTEMKRADQGFEQMKYITSVMLEVKKTLATVGTQLAAAAMSAVNIGASLSSSDGQSVGYSLGLSYSGSLDNDS